MVFKLVVWCSGFPLVPEISCAPLLSNSMDHLQGPSDILTYASMLGAAAVMLPCPMLMFIPAEPDFDEDMGREHGDILFFNSMTYLHRHDK